MSSASVEGGEAECFSSILFSKEMLIRSTINTTPNNNNKTWILEMPFLCFFLLVSLDLDGVLEMHFLVALLLINTRNTYL